MPESTHLIDRMHKPIFDYEIHYKCQRCQAYTALHSAMKLNEVKCKDSKCAVNIVKKADNFFIYIPLAQQIRESIGKHFDYIMNHRERERTERISDVHDGYICKKIDTENQHSIKTFVMNTDGARVFDSSTMSLWPVLLYQNFLPPRLRFIPENILVVALHYGESKPEMDDFLLPFIKELKQLQDSGLNIEKAAGNVIFKPFVSHCACDLPARAAVQALKQHNGKSSCGYCLHPGVTVENEKGDKKCRYINRNQVETLRTHKSFIKTAARVPLNGCIDGIKGISPLIGLNGFDLVHGFAIDYMHCIVIGVTPTLYKLWFDSKNSKKPFYLDKEKQKILNNRIKSIKPPSWISRKPRSMDQSLKANEKRNLLLYYLRASLPTLLLKKYVDHFQLLSAATYKLTKDSISPQELKEATLTKIAE